MNRDDIIRMAREAGAMFDHMTWVERDLAPVFERFAALVISHHVQETRVKPTASDREMLQQIAYQHGGIGDLSQTEFEFGALVAAQEREACTRLCEEIEMQGHALWKRTYDPDAQGRSTGAADCAAAIRARGEK